MAPPSGRRVACTSPTLPGFSQRRAPSPTARSGRSSYSVDARTSTSRTSSERVAFDGTLPYDRAASIRGSRAQGNTNRVAHPQVRDLPRGDSLVHGRRAHPQDRRQLSDGNPPHRLSVERARLYQGCTKRTGNRSETLQEGATPFKRVPNISSNLRTRVDRQPSTDSQLSRRRPGVRVPYTPPVTRPRDRRGPGAFSYLRPGPATAWTPGDGPDRS